MDTATLISFTLYLSVVVLIALFAYLVTRNLSDFVLGGRRLGGAVAALSSGASDMSAWLLLGLPGAVYVYGMKEVWLPIALVIGAYLNWKFVAKPLRVYTEVANDSLTIPAYLDNRFRDDSKAIRVISAAATLIFFAFYTASGLVASAILLQKSFGLDYQHALWFGTAIIIAYTFIGGFLAVSWTDFVQGTLMFFCLLAVPYLATKSLGGWDNSVDQIEMINPNLLDPFKGLTFLGLLNLAAWGLGYFGQPHILVRFMAVKSTKEIPLARFICMSWMTLSMLGAILTGFIGIAYFKGSLSNPETVFIGFSHALFSHWISGLIIAAILSSTMCAIDSQMLASSSALTEDIYHALIRKNKASQKELMWVGRIAVIMIAMVAISLASSPNSKVLDLVGFAWAGLGATFGPAVVLSLFWPRMTRTGAIWGMSLGAITVIAWKFGTDGSLYEMVPGYILSTLGVVLGSLYSKAPNKIIQEEYNSVQQIVSTEA